MDSESQPNCRGATGRCSSPPTTNDPAMMLGSEIFKSSHQGEPLTRVRKQSRIRSTVLDQVRDDVLLVQGRQELLVGIQELSRRIDWLRGNKRARVEARKLLKRKVMLARLESLETFLVVSTSMLVFLFVALFVVRAISIFLLPELFLECSPAGHPHLHYASTSVANCSADEHEFVVVGEKYRQNQNVEAFVSPKKRPVTGLRLSWMLIRGYHPCIPIYMECFSLQEPIVHPYQGQL